MQPCTPAILRVLLYPSAAYPSNATQELNELIVPIHSASKESALDATSLQQLSRRLNTLSHHYSRKRIPDCMPQADLTTDISYSHATNNASDHPSR